MIILIPNKICSDYSGFNNLIEIFNRVKNISFDTITFDFHNCRWFEANLCAVLGVICHNITQNINNVEFVNIDKKIENVFSKNGFLQHFGGFRLQDDNYTTIKYRRYQSNEQSLFKIYLDEELLTKKDFPKMSPFLKKKIHENIFEIFENSISHGASEYVFSCGQYYPQKSPPRIDFTIVDIGRSIKTNVNEFLKQNLSGIETIEWAVKEKNTTKTGNTPGGLGLKLIREFLKHNKGELQIISAEGFWQQDKKNIIFTKNLQNLFSGTIVNLEFNIDNNYYFTKKDKLNEQDIF
ncbi:MAG: hypothetical protein IMY72_02700 [Bacteroidetes bacterium]|nr:hypothetical protein [Bacteroidota bacterium]